MYEISKKQKIIIISIIAIIIISIIYYIYTKEEETVISTNEIEENIIESSEKNNTEETTKNNKIIVHISGAVNKEGIIELEENSRISDAVNKAEGLKENADTLNINLAFKLEDGMKIHIPTKEETAKQKEQTVQENTIDETSTYVTTSSSITKEEESKKNTKININTASQTELETLPGIGPATSQKIIDYREQNGKFKTIEQIKEVSGIGDAKYEKIKDQITTD